jgi:hypothetical protein
MKIARPRIASVAAGVALGAAVGITLLACTAGSGAYSSTSGGNPNSGGCNQHCDLTNIGSKYPDYYNLFMNVDGQPTIGMMCIGGAGIMTTSRDQSAAAARLVPEWDAFCKTQIGSRFSVTGNQDDEPRYDKIP